MADGGQIYIVDDDEEAANRLAETLAARTPWRALCFTGAESWLAAAPLECPGCVLLEHGLPGISGLTVLQEMQRRESPHQVVMLSESGNVAAVVEAMRAGACDFLEKPVLFDPLERSLILAFDRLREVCGMRIRAEEAKARISQLKPREQDVMMGLVQGKPNKIIAYNLGLSVRTVELYRAALMDRLAVDSVADILKIAYAAKMISM